jgi:hypothetical protein
MKKAYFAIFMICMVTCAVMQPSPAAAEWMMAHGNAGIVENPTGIGGDKIIYHVWGMEFYLKGMGAWIHFPIPTKYGSTWKANRINLRFWTETGAWVSQIEVYNGKQKIKQWNGEWAGQKNLTLNLGSNIEFASGVGISLVINSDNSNPGRKVAFYGAGAYFTQ